MWFLRACAITGLAMLWVGFWYLGGVLVELWLRRR